MPPKQRRGSVGSDVGAVDETDAKSSGGMGTGRGKGRGGDVHDEPLCAVEKFDKSAEISAEEAMAPLPPGEARRFRGIAARLNYLAPDRPEIQYAVKEAARALSSPRLCDWGILKKLGRYLTFRPRAVIVFEWQKAQGQLDGYTDSDWSGCGTTSKSTSGGVLMIGCHLIKSYSGQQRVISLSSA